MKANDTDLNTAAAVLDHAGIKLPASKPAATKAAILLRIKLQALAKRGIAGEGDRRATERVSMSDGR